MPTGNQGPLTTIVTEALVRDLSRDFRSTLSEAQIRELAKEHYEKYPLTPDGTRALLRDTIRDLKSGLFDLNDSEVRETLRTLEEATLRVLAKVAKNKS